MDEATVHIEVGRFRMFATFRDGRILASSAWADTGTITAEDLNALAEILAALPDQARSLAEATEEVL